MDSNIEKTLLYLSKALKDIRWVLIGSLSLEIQGVDIKANDMDIMTDKEGAFKIYEILKEYSLEMIEYNPTQHFRSYFCKYLINGIRIEVMGEFEVKSNGLWISLKNRLKNYNEILILGEKIKISKLEDEFLGYNASEREKDKNKAGKIRKAMELQQEKKGGLSTLWTL